MKTIMGAALLLLAAACTTTPEDGPPALTHDDPDGEYTCNAEGLQDLVGRPATAELGADAQRRSHSRTVRWIRPGDAVTMDFREDRLNINLDAQGRVERFNCG
jgi:hypothetical protein